MPRPTSDSPIVSLRACLASPFPGLRRAAVELVRTARARASTVSAAERLGVSRRALQRLLADFPELASPGDGLVDASARAEEKVRANERALRRMIADFHDQADE